MKKELLTYQNGELVLDVQVSPEKETVWLSQRQMSKLFMVSQDNIGLHIRNIFKSGELDETTTEKSSVVQLEGGTPKRRTVILYNLDMIISVGYRVNSLEGIAFRKWASKVLKDYIVQGYAANEKRLESLKKTIEIQSKMLSSVLEIENDELLNVINKYTDALDLLDDYDHQCIRKPENDNECYRITYGECRDLINDMGKDFATEVFGVEKEKGKLSGILDAVYQSAFGSDAYPSTLEKGANLLYFLIKDHPFADGCKRIASAIFLLFLYKNGFMKSKEKTICNSTLVAITLLIAESNPKEKDVMVSLVMNIINFSNI